MTYSGTICTEAEIALMAGENVDATGDTEDNHGALAAHAESYLSNLMRYNIVDNYSTLNEDVKRMFSEWAARYAGATLIAYNFTGFGTDEGNAIRISESMIDFHVYRMKQIEIILKEKAAAQDFFKGA